MAIDDENMTLRDLIAYLSEESRIGFVTEHNPITGEMEYGYVDLGHHGPSEIGPKTISSGFTSFRELVLHIIENSLDRYDALSTALQCQTMIPIDHIESFPGWWTNPPFERTSIAVAFASKRIQDLTWSANPNDENAAEGTAYIHRLMIEDIGRVLNPYNPAMLRKFISRTNMPTVSQIFIYASFNEWESVKQAVIAAMKNCHQPNNEDFTFTVYTNTLLYIIMIARALEIPRLVTCIVQTMIENFEQNSSLLMKDTTPFERDHIHAHLYLSLAAGAFFDENLEVAEKAAHDAMTYAKRHEQCAMLRYVSLDIVNKILETMLLKENVDKKATQNEIRRNKTAMKRILRKTIFDPSA